METTNIKLEHELSKIYCNVDGLSLQNLYYTTYGCFANCYMFTQSSKESDNYIDTIEFLKELKKVMPEDENMQYICYVTSNLTDGTESMGFCLFLQKSQLMARFEKCVSECYVLYKNEDTESLNTLIEIMKHHYEVPQKEKNNIYTIGSGQMGYSLIKSSVKEVADFNVNKQYNDDFAEEDEIISDFISEKDRSGLIILHGEKGTGKTTYIRHLINSHPERNFVFVPSGLVNILGDPSFSSFLISLSNHVIILEDCENVITDRRASGRSSEVSLLLNMTDGLLSDDLGIKFICTFNEDVKNIDSALMRKGRLVSKYEFKELSVEKTNKLLSELYPDEEITNNKPMTLSDIYNYQDKSYEKKAKSII